MNKNMTALISMFVRIYHTKNSNIKIYDDSLAEKIISREEYDLISKNMENGISFFNPNYKGNNPLEWIVNNQLAPSVLARSIFNEKHLLNEIKLGLDQYIVLASGYDMSGYKFNDKIKVYEIDKDYMITDKMKRIKNANINMDNVTYIKTDFNGNWILSLLETDYDKNKKTFCSLLGISYYLDKDTFYKTINYLANNISKGSTIVFDYPNDNQTDKEKVNQQLAKGANENMKSTYSYFEIEKLAENNNMIIYEHLNNKDIDNSYFYNYNSLNPNNKIVAPGGVNYCIMVKQ